MKVILPSVFTDVPPPWSVQGDYDAGPPEGSLKDLHEEAKAAQAAAQSAGIVDEATVNVLETSLAEIEAALN